MKTFKGFSFLMLVALISLTMTSCMHRTEIGQASVILEKYGDNKGIQPKAVGPGNYFESWGQDYFDFPTHQVNWSFTASETEGSKDNEEFSFQSVQGSVCKIDIGMSMHFDINKLPVMYAKYYMDIEGIRSVIVRNSIRNSLNSIASKMSIERIYGSGKDTMMLKVKKQVEAELNPNGIYIDQLAIIGEVRIPESTKEALDAKVNMEQESAKVQNAVAKEKAQADINRAKAQGLSDAMKIKADGEAYYNQTVSKSLTPQIVEMKRLEVWDGKYPTYYGINGGLMIK